MPLVLEEREHARPDFRFIGTDVVCDLIQNHTQTFADHPKWNFELSVGVLGTACLPHIPLVDS